MNIHTEHMLDTSAIKLVTEVDIQVDIPSGKIRTILSREPNHPFKRDPQANINDWDSFSASTTHTDLLQIRYQGKVLDIPFHEKASHLIIKALFDEEKNAVTIKNNYKIKKAIFSNSINNYQIGGYLYQKKDPPTIRLDDINFLWMMVYILLFHENLLNQGSYRHNMIGGLLNGGLFLIQKIGKYWHVLDDKYYPESATQVKDETLFFPVAV